MKAIVAEKYGHPQDLQIKEISQPIPHDNQVLIKVICTAINDYEWASVTGNPKLYRLLFGITKPKQPIPGMELSGIVEEVGENVVKFKPGDAVYGDLSEFGFGAFAEYVAVNEAALIHKPESMTHEQATTISHASMLAYQGLIDHGNLHNEPRGRKVLINGGGGGVGCFGLQFAKLMDAHVTGVDTGEKLNAMKAFGFDEVMDYKKEDFTRRGTKYDLILDAKTNRRPGAYARALNRGGTYSTVGGGIGRMIQILVSGPFYTSLANKNLRIVALKPNKDLKYMNELHEHGRLRYQIDGPYDFEEIPRLIQYFGEGKHSGKIVVRVARN